MQIVELDSYFHYKTFEREGKIVLLEFPEDACPRMNQRPPFTDAEGKEIASWEKGEVVRFVYDSYHGSVGATDKVLCGDDFRYQIKE